MNRALHFLLALFITLQLIMQPVQGVAHGADTTGSGIVALWTGESPKTLGGALLPNIGLTPEQAEIAYGLAGLGLEAAALRTLLTTPAHLSKSVLDNYAASGKLPDIAPNTAPTGGFGPTYRAADDPNLEKILTSYYGTVKTGGGRVGTGGLGDALRYEKATGELLSETGHLQKAIDQRRRLKAYVKKADNQPPGTYPNSKRDVEFAKELIKDLDNAIGY